MKRTRSSRRVREFFENLAEPFTGEALFDYLEDTIFFIKNAHYEYVAVNHTMASRSGLGEKEALLGRTASALFRAPYGDQFEDQDRALLKSGTPLLGELELGVYPGGMMGWCLTTKIPLLDKAKRVTGIVGISRDLPMIPSSSAEEVQQISTAVHFIESHLDEPITVPQVAKVSQMSTYQLDRRMKLVYGLTTSRWILKIRIDRARSLLTQSDDDIASIAIDVGYADQSAFTRQFRRVTGYTPSDYRNLS